MHFLPRFRGRKHLGPPQYVGESPPPPGQEEEGSVGLRNQKREEGCNWALSPEWDFSHFSGGYFVLVVGQTPYKERKTFRPGTKVWLLTPSVKPGTARKLANPWSGPWIVCADGVNDFMVRIRPHPDWSDSQATRVVFIDRLKLYGDGATV